MLSHIYIYMLFMANNRDSLWFIVVNSGKCWLIMVYSSLIVVDTGYSMGQEWVIVCSSGSL